MSMTAQVQAKPAPSFTPVRANLLQRKCACGGTPDPTGECEECRKKRLQRRSAGQAGLTTAPSVVHDVLRSPGQPLDANTRAFMEPRFGHDFGRVRVHADARAAESAHAVNALAYTVGRDMVFGAGQYAPETGEGRRLLAHELTHVVQQRDVTASRDRASKVNALDQAGEREAHVVADLVSRGASPHSTGDAPTRQPIRIGTVPKVAIQRAPRRAKRKPDPPAPEQTSFDITGRYEAIDPDSDNRVTVQINHVGTYFEGWWQRRVTDGTDGLSIMYRRLVGELRSDEGNSLTFTYVGFGERSEAVVLGRLTAVLKATDDGNTVEITLSETGWSQAFRQVSNLPRLPAEAIGAAESPGLVEAMETAPLDAAQEAKLVGICEGITARIKDYVEEEARPTSRRFRANKVSQYVRESLEGVPEEQKPLIIRRMQQLLAELTFTNEGVTRSLWDWLQGLVRDHPGHTEDIQRLLRMPAGGAGSAAPVHKYVWQYDVAGGEVKLLAGIGVFGGTFFIEKLEPDKWSATYGVWLLEGSLGASAGGKVGVITDPNEFEAEDDWRSRDFNGRFEIYGASGEVGPSSIDLASMMVFYGSGTHDPIFAASGGVDTILGLSYGGGPSAIIGYLFWGGTKETVGGSVPKEPTVAKSGYTTKAKAYFTVDDASLTYRGFQAIVEMCARHLAAFRQPESTLEIHGYTSTTGKEEHNQELSELRAKNTLQAIRDILGSAFAIPEGSWHTEGHGEIPAREAARKANRGAGGKEKIPEDNYEDPAWRKVEIILNGKLVLTLSEFSPPEPSEKPPTSKTSEQPGEFPISERRALWDAFNEIMVDLESIAAGTSGSVLTPAWSLELSLAVETLAMARDGVCYERSESAGAHPVCRTFLGECYSKQVDEQDEDLCAGYPYGCSDTVATTKSLSRATKALKALVFLCSGSPKEPSPLELDPLKFNPPGTAEVNPLGFADCPQDDTAIGRIDGHVRSIEFYISYLGQLCDRFPG